jgi:hypothetical protein
MQPEGAFTGLKLAGLGQDLPGQCGWFESLESGVHGDLVFGTPAQHVNGTLMLRPNDLQ